MHLFFSYTPLLSINFRATVQSITATRAAGSGTWGHRGRHGRSRGVVPLATAALPTNWSGSKAFVLHLTRDVPLDGLLGLQVEVQARVRPSAERCQTRLSGSDSCRRYGAGCAAYAFGLDTPFLYLLFGRWLMEPREGILRVITRTCKPQEVC